MFVRLAVATSQNADLTVRIEYSERMKEGLPVSSSGGRPFLRRILPHRLFFPAVLKAWSAAVCLHKTPTVTNLSLQIRVVQRLNFTQFTGQPMGLGMNFKRRYRRGHLGVAAVSLTRKLKVKIIMIVSSSRAVTPQNPVCGHLGSPPRVSFGAV